MSVKYGNWHGLSVEREDERDPESELLYEFMHSGDCAWSTDHHSRVVNEHGTVLSEAMYVQRYSCDVQHAVDEWGFDDLPKEPGLYWLRIEHVVYPGGPWGSTEYDQHMTFTVARQPGAQIEAGEP